MSYEIFYVLGIRRHEERFMEPVEAREARQAELICRMAHHFRDPPQTVYVTAVISETGAVTGPNPGDLPRLDEADPVISESFRKSLKTLSRYASHARDLETLAWFSERLANAEWAFMELPKIPPGSRVAPAMIDPAPAKDGPSDFNPADVLLSLINKHWESARPPDDDLVVVEAFVLLWGDGMAALEPSGLRSSE